MAVGYTNTTVPVTTSTTWGKQKGASASATLNTVKQLRVADGHTPWLTQHMEHCDADIEGPEILATADRRMKNPKFDLRVMENLFIKKYNCGPGKGMNEDFGSYVTTTQWQPVFNKLRR